MIFCQTSWGLLRKSSEGGGGLWVRIAHGCMSVFVVELSAAPTVVPQVCVCVFMINGAQRERHLTYPSRLSVSAKKSTFAGVPCSVAISQRLCAFLVSKRQEVCELQHLSTSIYDPTLSNKSHWSLNEDGQKHSHDSTNRTHTPRTWVVFAGRVAGMNLHYCRLPAQDLLLTTCSLGRDKSDLVYQNALLCNVREEGAIGKLGPTGARNASDP